MGGGIDAGGRGGGSASTGHGGGDAYSKANGSGACNCEVYGSGVGSARGGGRIAGPALTREVGTQTRLSLDAASPDLAGFELGDAVGSATGRGAAVLGNGRRWAPKRRGTFFFPTS